jgi:hypothetical protein
VSILAAGTKKNRRGCRRFVWVFGSFRAYASTSPAAGRGEIQEYEKKNAVREGMSSM